MPTPCALFCVEIEQEVNRLSVNCRFLMWQYRYVPHNNVSVHNRPHIRQWSIR